MKPNPSSPVEQPQYTTASDDTLIPIQELTSLLPKKENGRRIHLSTVYRWISNGVDGYCLQSVKVGGKRYTTIAAIKQFVKFCSLPPEKKLALRRAGLKNETPSVCWPRRMNSTIPQGRDDTDAWPHDLPTPTH